MQRTACGVEKEVKSSEKLELGKVPILKDPS